MLADPPIRSRKYLNGARGECCKLRIAGVNCSGSDTVVACHVRDCHTGRSVKASDTSTVDGCFNCHEVFDRRAKLPSGEYLSDADWLFYALRGLQETLEARIAAGLLFLSQDVVKPFGERPAKPRKPPERRAKIQQRKTDWPTRPLRQRNTLRKSPEEKRTE